jgi:hypothetical protein
MVELENLLKQKTSLEKKIKQNLKSKIIIDKGEDLEVELKSKSRLIVKYPTDQALVNKIKYRRDGPYLDIDLSDNDWNRIRRALKGNDAYLFVYNIWKALGQSASLSLYDVRKAANENLAKPFLSSYKNSIFKGMNLRMRHLPYRILPSRYIHLSVDKKEYRILIKIG